MPRRSGPPPLSRRERQIMDILYRLERATAAEVQEAMTDAPGYSAVRAHLRVLEEKGHVVHDQDGPRYVFRPRVPRDRARKSALDQVVTTFFGGSAVEAVSTLLDMNADDIDPDELEALSKLIDQAREEGR